MNALNLLTVDDLPTVFTVTVEREPRRSPGAVGGPVEMLGEAAMLIWPVTIGPGAVVVARVLLAEPDRSWHIADVAARLEATVGYAQRCVRRLAEHGWLTATIADNGTVVYRLSAASDITVEHLDRLHPVVVSAIHTGLIGGLR